MLQKIGLRCRRLAPVRVGPGSHGHNVDSRVAGRPPPVRNTPTLTNTFILKDSKSATQRPDFQIISQGGLVFLCERGYPRNACSPWASCHSISIPPLTNFSSPAFSEISDGWLGRNAMMGQGQQRGGWRATPVSLLLSARKPPRPHLSCGRASCRIMEAISRTVCVRSTFTQGSCQLFCKVCCESE